MDGSRPDRFVTVSAVSRQRFADGRSKSTCRPGSNFLPTAQRSLSRRITPPESRQTPGRFVPDKTVECLADKSCLLGDSGVILRLLEQLVIQRNCCTHMHILAPFRC